LISTLHFRPSALQSISVSEFSTLWIVSLSAFYLLFDVSSSLFKHFLISVFNCLAKQNLVMVLSNGDGGLETTRIATENTRREEREKEREK